MNQAVIIGFALVPPGLTALAVGRGRAGLSNHPDEHVAGEEDALLPAGSF